jgi:hypothetical protein
MVIVSPGTPPVALNAGVVSFVMSSAFDDPESDAVSRSIAKGAEGAAESTVSEVGADEGETFPAASVNVAANDHVPSDNVGKSHDDAGTT